MNIILMAGYPKSGNTLLGHSFLFAGKEASSEWDYAISKNNPGVFYDIYDLKREKSKPPVNPIFKDPTACIKTHELFRYSTKLHAGYYGDVRKVITIARNPFETLLSSINFLGHCFKSHRFTNDHIMVLRQLLPEIEFNPATFLTDISLERLRDAGLLDSALIRFAKLGTVFSIFYNMSGPWCTFIKSYQGCGSPTLHIRFEDLVNSRKKAANDISQFLDIDPKFLSNGLEKQKEYALQKKADNSSFFKIVGSGYWKDYFSLKSCRYFVDIYHREMELAGYSDVCAEVFQ